MRTFLKTNLFYPLTNNATELKHSESPRNQSYHARLAVSRSSGSHVAMLRIIASLPQITVLVGPVVGEELAYVILPAVQNRLDPGEEGEVGVG